MNHPVFFAFARILIVCVFIGLGAERLLGAAGIGPAANITLSNGTLALSAFELIAGLLIAFGWQVRWLALLMAAFLTFDAALAHPFWRYAGTEQHAQLLHFLKNLSSIGGLLLLAIVSGTKTRRLF
jgi:putative oxidoreductase